MNRVVQLRKGDWAKADSIVIELKRKKLDEMQNKLQSGDLSLFEMQDYEKNRRKLIDGITGVLEQNRREALADPANAGKDSEAAVSERITRILSQEYVPWGRTLREELAVTLKGTQAAGVVAAMEKGDAAETAARRLLEMEARDTTRAVKIAELMRGLRQQADRDVMASLPTLPLQEKEALLADPKGRKRQLVDARAATYIADFKRVYEEIRGRTAARSRRSSRARTPRTRRCSLRSRRAPARWPTSTRSASRSANATPTGIKEVLRRQGTAESILDLDVQYQAKFKTSLRTAIFGASGAKAAMHPMNMFRLPTTIVHGRDAAQIDELLQTPAEVELGTEKEVDWITAGGAQEVTVTEDNSGTMGSLRELGDDPDTQKMMNQSAQQLKRLQAAFRDNPGNPALQAAIVREMKKVRATLTGDATAYEEENARMVEQLRSAVSLAVQIGLAFAIPGAGAGLAGFVANTAINIGATVASNMVIYGEQYNLSRFYDDVVGGGLGAIGGKLGEDLAKVVTGSAAKGVANAATDVGMPATRLGSQIDEAAALGARGGLGVKAVVEGFNIAGSSAGTMLATGENQFTLDAIIQNLLMNRIGDIKEAFTRPRPAGGPAAAPPAEGGPPPAPEGAVPAPGGGEAQRPHDGDGGGVPVRDPTRPADQDPHPAGGSVSPADGTARAPASAAERAEARGMWQHMEQVGSEWPGLPEAGRRAHLSDVANRLLEARGVPAITVVPDKPSAAGNQAEFDFKKWGIRIDPALINRTPLDAHAVAEMTELIRHETEHALQWWAMARLRASQPGASAAQLAAELRIDPQDGPARRRERRRQPDEPGGDGGGAGLLGQRLLPDVQAQRPARPAQVLQRAAQAPRGRDRRRQGQGRADRAGQAPAARGRAQRRRRLRPDLPQPPRGDPCLRARRRRRRRGAPFPGRAGGRPRPGRRRRRQEGPQGRRRTGSRRSRTPTSRRSPPDRTTRPWPRRIPGSSTTTRATSSAWSASRPSSSARRPSSRPRRPGSPAAAAPPCRPRAAPRWLRRPAAGFERRRARAPPAAAPAGRRRRACARPRATASPASACGSRERD